MKKNNRFVDLYEETPSTEPTGLREFLASLIDEQRHRMAADINSLSPEKRLQILEKLMPYVLPKQSEIRAEVTGIDLHMEMAKHYLERKGLNKESVDLFGNEVFGRDDEETSKVREIQFAVLKKLEEEDRLNDKNLELYIRGFDEEKEIAEDILEAVKTYARSKSLDLSEHG